MRLKTYRVNRINCKVNKLTVIDIKINFLAPFLLLIGIFFSCEPIEKKGDMSLGNDEFKKGSYGFDKAFLKKHYQHTIVLENPDEQTSIVLSPENQGRVMTSSLEGDQGLSFGWLNYDLISSGKKLEHINPTGGEERFWLGPEGGQFSVFFKPGSNFSFNNWYVPSSLDTESFRVLEREPNQVLFEKEMKLVNYSGTEFELLVQRRVSLLNRAQIESGLKLSCKGLSVVAYETVNSLKNTGEEAWTEKTGLLSIWLLSMLVPSPDVTVIIPIEQGSTEERGVRVNDNYFGKIAKERLLSTETHVFFKADGKRRGKIGISPLRSTGLMGSYDALNHTLTLLQIEPAKRGHKYVNSAWEWQENPYSGDVLNAYNDGPLEDGSQMGPFYELESSSPALALKPSETDEHVQRIYHFEGDHKSLDRVSTKMLNISLSEIEDLKFKNHHSTQ